MSRDVIEVYAHWQPIDQPLLVGIYPINLKVHFQREFKAI